MTINLYLYYKAPSFFLANDKEKKFVANKEEGLLTKGSMNDICRHKKEDFYQQKIKKSPVSSNTHQPIDIQDTYQTVMNQNIWYVPNPKLLGTKFLMYGCCLVFDDDDGDDDTDVSTGSDIIFRYYCMKA